MSTKSILMTLGLLGSLLGSAALAVASDELDFRHIAIGENYPQFCGNRSDGARLCAGDLAGRVAVVIFFRPGQELSTRQLAVLQELHAEYGSRKVKIVAIAEQGEEGSTVAGLVRQVGITFPVLLDGDRKLAGRFGVYAYPSTGVFGPDGSLRFFTASNWVNYRNAVEGRIRALIGEPTAGPGDRPATSQSSAADMAYKRAETRYHLAKTLYDHGELAKAEQVLDQALADFEGHAPSHLLLSRIAHEQGDEQRRRKHLERALQLDPAVRSADQEPEAD